MHGLRWILFVGWFVVVFLFIFLLSALCDLPSKHACEKIDTSMVDITERQKTKHLHYCIDSYIKKKSKAAEVYVLKYRLEMFLHLLYTTKEHVTLCY